MTQLTLAKPDHADILIKLIGDFHVEEGLESTEDHRATAIEEIAQTGATALPQEQRNAVMATLFTLTLREVFEFHLTQSDPNFANYRYCTSGAEAGRILLLDFGATRPLEAGQIPIYRRFLQAGLNRDRAELSASLRDLGFLASAPTDNDRFENTILDMVDMCFAAITAEAEFDFAKTDLIRRLREKGMELAAAGYVPPSTPPLHMDVLYLQRKLGGMALLATRLEARLPLAAMLRDFL